MINETAFKPMNDRVLVRRVPEAPDDSLIITPDIAKEPSFRGVVVALGPGKMSEKTGKRTPIDLKLGDIVVFGKYTDFDRDDLVLIQEADIRFKIEAV